MKSRFALDLTNEAISLLERKGDGWVRIGQAGLSGPGLDARLANLSRIAEARGAGDYVTKLMLPNFQILYLDLEAPGPDRAAQRAQIRAALDGRTPYAVDDLVFDWSRSGSRVKVAVLARETLDEAEEFAESCGFRPVAFVAVPEGDQFAGEPFFGLTTRCQDYLPPGERFDRDQDPVRVVGEDLVILPPASEPEVEPEPAVVEEEPPAPEPPIEAAIEEAAVEEVADAPEGTAAPEPDAVETASGLEEHVDVVLGEMAETPDEAASEGVMPSDEESDGDFAVAEPPSDVPDIDEATIGDLAPEIMADSLAETAPTQASNEQPAGDTVVAEPLSYASGANQATIDTVAPEIAAEIPAEPAAVPAAAAKGEIAGETAFVMPKTAHSDDEIGVLDVSAEAALAEATPEPAAMVTAETADIPAISQPAPTEVPVAETAGEAPFVALEDEPDAPDAHPTEAEDASAYVIAADAPDFDGAVADANATAFQSRRPPGPTGQEGARLAEITPRLGGLSGMLTPSKAPRLGAAAPKLVAGGRAATALSRAGAGSAALGRSMLQTARAGRAARPFDRVTASPAPEPARSIFGALKGVAADRPAWQMIVPLVLVLMLGAGALWSLWFTGAANPEPEVTTAPAPADPAPAAPAPQAQAPEPAAEPALPAETETAADLPQPDAPTAAPAPPTAAAGEPTSPPAVTLTEAAPPIGPEAALPELAAREGDLPLPAQPLPQPFGTVIRFDATGLIVATPDGVITPDGFTLYAARPPLLPPPRPGGIAPAPAATDPAAPVSGQNPLPRPEDLVPAPGPDGAALDPGAEVAAAPLPEPVDPRHTARKPLSRPAGIVAQAEAKRLNDERVADAAASAARAEAEAAEAALAAASKLAVASSRRPSVRSASAVASAAAAAMAAAAPAPVAVDNNAVEAALAEAQAAPAEEPTPAAAPAPEVMAAAPAEPIPEELDEPEPQDGVPDMPTTRTVAKKSTIANAIDLGDINLIGVYGSSANRRALVRMPNGRFVKVKVGDRLDGGKVAAIGDSELSYVKRGRTYVLKILKNS